MKLVSIKAAATKVGVVLKDRTLPKRGRYAQGINQRRMQMQMKTKSEQILGMLHKHPELLQNTYQELSKICGASIYTIQKVVKASKLPKQDKRGNNIDPHQFCEQLTEDERDDLKRTAAYKKARVLAEYYGVSLSTIYKYRAENSCVISTAVLDDVLEMIEPNTMKRQMYRDMITGADIEG